MGAIATQIILMLHKADCLCDPAEGLGTNNTILLGSVQFPAHGCKPHLTGHGCRTHPFPKEYPLTWTMAQDHSLKSYKTITMGSLQHWNKNRRCLGSPWCDQHFLGCSYVFGRSRNLHSPHHINNTLNLPDLLCRATGTCENNSLWMTQKSSWRVSGSSLPMIRPGIYMCLCQRLWRRNQKEILGKILQEK